MLRAANHWGRSVRDQRLIGVVIASALCAALTTILALNAGVQLLRITEFATCEFMLGVVSFRWWYQPLYRTVYNYCSPLAIVCTVAYIYGGPGNTLSFVHDDLIFSTNVGAFDYFQWPMISAVVGVFLFDVVYRATSRALRENRVYPFSTAERVAYGRVRFGWYAVLWVAASMGIYLYLGTKYSLFTQGSIAGSDLDNVLFQSRFILLMTAWAAVSSLLANARTVSGRAASCLLLIALLPNLMTSLSRQYAVHALVCTLFTFLLVRRTSFVRIRTMAALGAAGIILFVVLTSVRSALMYGQMSVDQLDVSMSDAMLSSHADLDTSLLSLASYDQNRLSGLELPAAIERSRETGGIPWMYGSHNWLFIVRIVPRFIWPGKPDTDPEVAINRHFGLADVDQLTVPFGSGYADGGIVGVAVGLAFMGLSLCLIQHVVWKLRSGALIYAGSTVILLNFEQYIAEYPLGWVRALVVVLLVDVVIRVATKPFGETTTRPRGVRRAESSAEMKSESGCLKPEDKASCLTPGAA